MSIAAVVPRGYGPAASIAFVVRRGYSVSSTPSPPPPPPAVGFPGRTIKRSEFEQKLKDQRDNTFSRRWFDEFQAAKKAQAEAERKAEELTASKQQRALERAAQAAADALNASEQIEAVELESRLTSMTAALEAAAGAGKVREAIKQARAAENFAISIMAYLDEMDDDEAAVMLLMQ